RDGSLPPRRRIDRGAQAGTRGGVEKRGLHEQAELLEEANRRHCGLARSARRELEAGKRRRIDFWRVVADVLRDLANVAVDLELRPLIRLARSWLFRLGRQCTLRAQRCAPLRCSTSD